MHWREEDFLKGPNKMVESRLIHPIYQQFLTDSFCIISWVKLWDDTYTRDHWIQHHTQLEGGRKLVTLICIPSLSLGLFRQEKGRLQTILHFLLRSLSWPVHLLRTTLLFPWVTSETLILAALGHFFLALSLTWDNIHTHTAWLDILTYADFVLQDIILFFFVFLRKESSLI